MKESVQDETLFAVGEIANESKQRRGRPRIHADDAARKRDFNQRRAQAHARARAAERRADRWKTKATELEEHLRHAIQQAQTLEQIHKEREAKLLARIDRLERQLAQAVRRKQWALERKDRVVAENHKLRDDLRRAWRAAHERAADPRNGPIGLHARPR